MQNCECMVLARAYIVNQKWPEELYDLKCALINGTVFPCLNQPMCDYEWGETV